MSGEQIRPALVPGHGAPSEHGDTGPGSGGRTNLDASVKGRADAIDWNSIPGYAEHLEAQKRRRDEREGKGRAS